MLKDIGVIAAWAFGVFFVAFFAQFTALQLVVAKTDNTGKFNVKAEQVIQDLNGKVVAVTSSQVWPFDVSQNINLKIIGKKPFDELVTVVVELDAVAPVNKEQAAKESPGQKIPAKLKLNGRMKLNYEYLEKEWYLVSVDNLSLKVTPLD